MEDSLLDWAKTFSPLIGTADGPLGRPPDLSPAAAAGAAGGGGGDAATAGGKIVDGTPCVARAAAAVFAGADSWERVARLARGQEVVAAGPPVTAEGGFAMVPLRAPPGGHVDSSVLAPRVLAPRPRGAERAEQPCVCGSWDRWSAMSEMEWREVEGYYQVCVRLASSGVENFQIAYNGDWRRCLHPDVDDTDPNEDRTICGPDDKGYRKCWIVGGGSETAAGQEDRWYTIQLFLGSDGRAERVAWASGRLEPEVLDSDVEEPGGGPGLHPGLLVRIHSLVRNPSLNGQTCLCERWDAAVGRWRVRLRSGEIKALKPEHFEEASDGDYEQWQDGSDNENGAGDLRRPLRASGTLRPGLVARLCGLRGGVALNGGEAVLEAWDPAQGRWVVRLWNGERKALRPWNLTAAAPLVAVAPGGPGRGGDGLAAGRGALGPRDAFVTASAPTRGHAGQGAAAAPRLRRARLGLDLKPRRPGRGPVAQERAAWAAAGDAPGGGAAPDRGSQPSPGVPPGEAPPLGAADAQWSQGPGDQPPPRAAAAGPEATGAPAAQAVVFPGVADLLSQLDSDEAFDLGRAGASAGAAGGAAGGGAASRVQAAEQDGAAKGAMYTEAIMARVLGRAPA